MGPAGEQARADFYSALVDDDPDRLYDLAPCGYLSTSPDGLISKANQTFLTLTGYERADLVGRRHFVELLAPGGRIYHETHYTPMLFMHGRVQEIALELVRADGERLAVLVNSALERDPDGAPRTIRTAVFDATERRGYEQELLLAKRQAEESEARATALARTLQQTLIPPAPPTVPGLEVAGVYRPAGDGGEVGGDFYDVFQVAPGDWAVAIGDVSGKGVDAAVVTALARHALRAESVDQASPSAALEALNRVLLHHPTDRFCTVALLRLRQDRGAWSATLCCAGHPAPLLASAAGGSPRAVDAAGTLLGILPDVHLVDVVIPLAPGDALVLFTDGVTEGRRDGEFYGAARLQESVTRHTGSAASLVNGLLADALEFQADRPRDDMAVVSVMVPMA